MEHQTGYTLPAVPPQRRLWKCVLGAVHWQAKREVQEALQGPLVPDACPSGRLFIPHSARSSVLAWGHQSKIACHQGVHRTLSLIPQCFWWPSITSNVLMWLNARSAHITNHHTDPHWDSCNLYQSHHVPGLTSHLILLPDSLLLKVATQF